MPKKQTATKKEPEPKQGKMMAIIGEVDEVRFINDLSELQDVLEMEEFDELSSGNLTGKVSGTVDIVTSRYDTGKGIMVFQADKKDVIRPVRLDLEKKYVIVKRG